MKLCEKINYFPLDWQKEVIFDWLSRKVNEKYTYSICGLTIARQNGKNYILEIRLLFGMLFYGEKILYTCHEGKLQREVFKRFIKIIEKNPAIFAHRVKFIRRVNGEQSIVLENGAEIKFITRTKRGGVGETVDVLVLDEAHFMSYEEYEALLPTISHPELENPQTIMIGTAPVPDIRAEVFGRIRYNAVQKRVRGITWTEYSPENLDKIEDESLWIACNPSFGSGISLETIRSEFESMSKDSFARQRLNYWSQEAQTGKMIDIKEWKELALDDIQQVDRYCVGVEFSHDGSSVSVAVAVKNENEPIYTETCFYKSQKRGIEWITQWIYSHIENIDLVAMNGLTGVDTLYEKLRKAGVYDYKMHKLLVKDVIAAHAMFMSAIHDKQLRHKNQKLVDLAVKNAGRMVLGQTGFKFKSIDVQVDIIPLTSQVVAY
ncbi:MAG: phage terminase family protein [Candidatus Ancillula sp.]|nr:phage terminase family protein [Candidatus Ancillula sp.]